MFGISAGLQKVPAGEVASYHVVLAFMVGYLGFGLYLCSLGPTYLDRFFGRWSQRAQVFLRASGELLIWTAMCWVAVLNHSLSWSLWSIVGGACLLVSLYVCHQAVRVLGVTSVHMTEADTLITDGIYARVRHPQALGRVLFAFGVAGVLNSVLLLVLAVFQHLPGFVIDAYLEDREMPLRFGHAFHAYASRVPGLVPRMRKS